MEREFKYPQLNVGSKTGDEKFRVGGADLGPTILDFWRWSASDLVSNATRGVLAEYIVATALGLADGVRREWDAFDLLTKDGLRIEVKSAAYLQSWGHDRLSKIIFGIRPTKAWNSAEAVIDDQAKRQADIYVFCLLKHEEKDTLDPLDLGQWEFYLLPATLLDANCQDSKTISLGRLKGLHPRIVDYDGLADCVKEMSAEITPGRR